MLFRSPSSNGYYVSFLPKEKVAELWCFNSFCSVIMSWAPPAIFIALNQSTGSLRLGLLGTTIFLFMGLCIGVFIPERVVARETDEENGADALKSKANSNITEMRD